MNLTSIIKDSHGYPSHSVSAQREYPAPDRSMYFTGEDYAMACARRYGKLLRYDGKIKLKGKACESARTYHKNFADNGECK